ncbi:hypothetical protein B0H12DRAFT_434554 [Mycena haematopus]|nr:hypothetical protein B0H12DRAFT_434554 [Mycena haematopus]
MHRGGSSSIFSRTSRSMRADYSKLLLMEHMRVSRSAADIPFPHSELRHPDFKTFNYSQSSHIASCDNTYIFDPQALSISYAFSNLDPASLMLPSSIFTTHIFLRWRRTTRRSVIGTPMCKLRGDSKYSETGRTTHVILSICDLHPSQIHSGTESPSSSLFTQVRSRRSSPPRRHHRNSHSSL